MARLVTKFKYLKPDQEKPIGGYATYIATREGVEKIDESFKLAPATVKQQKLIEKLLRDFPDSATMLEYEDYQREKTVGVDGHVGYTVGGGYAVEWRGFAYGCVKTKIKGRGWTHWYKLPFIDYNDAASSVPEKEIALGSRLLKKGTEGSDVKALQEALMKLGYELPDYGADGEFGVETKETLMDFQKDEGLEVDGEYGEKSHAALMDALSDEEAGNEDDDDEADTPTEPKPLGVTVAITGGSVYVRVGNGTNYRAITTVKAGMTFDHIATAHNGWNAIVINGQVGWVSGKYSKVV